MSLRAHSPGAALLACPVRGSITFGVSRQAIDDYLKAANKGVLLALVAIAQTIPVLTSHYHVTHPPSTFRAWPVM